MEKRRGETEERNTQLITFPPVPSLYSRERYVLRRSRSLMLVEKNFPHRDCLGSIFRATDMFPLLDSIHISTCSWAVHKGGCERSILFEGKTGTVTDRPLPGLGPKPRQFGTTYIEMGTSSKSILNSDSIPYRHKDW